MGVTLEVVQALLITKQKSSILQLNFCFKTQDVKEDIKSIRKDITDLQASLQFTQAKFEESNQEMEQIRITLSMHSENLNDINQQADQVDNQLEYLEI